MNKNNNIITQVYATGDNEYCQCGTGSNKPDNIYLPVLVSSLEQQTVMDIRTGSYHNTVRTEENKYYLWGYNRYNQCLYMDKSTEIPDYIKQPLELDCSFMDEDEEIVDIYPGWKETRILVGRKTVQWFQLERYESN